MYADCMRGIGQCAPAATEVAAALSFEWMAPKKSAGLVYGGKRRAMTARHHGPSWQSFGTAARVQSSTLIIHANVAMERFWILAEMLADAFARNRFAGVRFASNFFMVQGLYGGIAFMVLEAGEEDERNRARAFFEDCARLHYEALFKSVVRYLRRQRQGGDMERIWQDADDVVAQAFLKMIQGVETRRPSLLEHLHDFGFSARHPGVIRYMAKVCQNTAVDMHRKESRGEKLIPPDDPVAADQFWGFMERIDKSAREEAERDDDTPENRLIKSEEEEAVRKALQVYKKLEEELSRKEAALDVETHLIFEEMREQGRVRNATWKVYLLVWKAQKSHDEAAAELGVKKHTVENQVAIIKKILKDVIADLRDGSTKNGY